MKQLPVMPVDKGDIAYYLQNRLLTYSTTGQCPRSDRLKTDCMSQTASTCSLYAQAFNSFLFSPLQISARAPAYSILHFLALKPRKFSKLNISHFLQATCQIPKNTPLHVLFPVLPFQLGFCGRLLFSSV